MDMKESARSYILWAGVWVLNLENVVAAKGFIEFKGFDGFALQ